MSESAEERSEEQTSAALVDADTIAAIATAPGLAGVGVIRISGAEASRIGRALLGGLPSPRQASLRQLSDPLASDPDQALIDEGIALWFPAPNSFTGEDVLEWQGHGGPVVLQLVLDAIRGQGARLARPGEFSERAFLNGKMDLAQAEAVADLIASASASAARGAVRALRGEFSDQVHALVADLTGLRVLVEATVDFPDEDIDVIESHDVVSRIAQLIGNHRTLIANSRQGRLLAEGVSVVLVGAPNVGKSSLLNALLGSDRAIVTDIPGTTRDLIEADLVLDGMPVRLVDTAGLRDSEDPVEAAGIARTQARRAQADLEILVRSAEQATELEPALGDPAQAADIARAPLSLTVVNKSDLVDPKQDRIADAVYVSALTGDGLEALRGEIAKAVGREPGDGQFTARQRHLDALDHSVAALETALENIDAQAGIELVAEELRLAQDSLGSITGQFTADDLLGEIFGSFCIGK
ncbi:MAG: tRNA uridine-5-carboxymethylaminomethyl(34) synthesis GTPase MnmE [Pseudomonadaceae bacterium]|nr:tRNA uridine-5-carboxymethylaminomethyl(34) synthesis GTPase MnmE [Pseudomonadaceae bacterium]